MNIYQKLASIRKEMSVIQKDAEGYNYKYVSDTQVLARLLPLMEQNHISLIPEVVPGTARVTQIITKKQKWHKDAKAFYVEETSDMLYTADCTMTWVNDDDPAEKIAVPWSLIGQQADAAQGFGSALSYALRYFVLKYFDIATPEDDPDSFRSLQQEIADESKKKAAAELAKALAEKRKEIVSAGSELIKLGYAPDDIRTTVGKHNGGEGSPNKIESIEVAEAVLAEFAELKKSPKKEEAN